MADATAKPLMGPGIELTRAGPVDTFRDLEIGHGQQSAMQKTVKGPSSGPKNELRRLTSLRKAFTSGEFWQSLPLLSKIFFITSFICGLLVIAFSIQQMASVSLHCRCSTCHTEQLRAERVNSDMQCRKQIQSCCTSALSCW